MLIVIFDNNNERVTYRYLFYLSTFIFKTIFRPPETEIRVENSLESKDYDGIVIVHVPEQKFNHSLIDSAISAALKCDPSLKSEIAVIPIGLPASRLVYSPLGTIDDYDDVRVFKNSAYVGVKRALKAGIRRPLLVLPDHPLFEKATLVTLLGALEALYTVRL